MSRVDRISALQIKLPSVSLQGWPGCGLAASPRASSLGCRGPSRHCSRTTSCLPAPLCPQCGFFRPVGPSRSSPAGWVTCQPARLGAWAPGEVTQAMPALPSPPACCSLPPLGVLHDFVSVPSASVEGYNSIQLLKAHGSSPRSDGPCLRPCLIAAHLIRQGGSLSLIFFFLRLGPDIDRAFPAGPRYKGRPQPQPRPPVPRDAGSCRQPWDLGRGTVANIPSYIGQPSAGHSCYSQHCSLDC